MTDRVPTAEVAGALGDHGSRRRSAPPGGRWRAPTASTSAELASPTTTDNRGVRSRRSVSLWITLVTASVFGPYVLGGLRTEQFAIYLSAAAVVLLGWPTWRRVRDLGPLPVLLLWGAMAAIAAGGAIWPPFNRTSYPAGSTFAGLDNVALPIAVIVVVWFWTQLVPVRTIATGVARVIVVAMMANAVLSIGAMFAGGYEAMRWVEWFWMSKDGTAPAVADLALQLDRYTGIFNQPTEAGICYSLALFCLHYLARVTERPRTGLVIGGVLLAFGGILTVSKVFLLFGLPVIVFIMLWDHRGRRGIVLAFALILAIFQALQGARVLENWYGLRSLSTLFDSDRVSTSTLTAGRFGEGGTLAHVGDQVLAHHGWFGMGAAGIQTPYDSTWLAAIIMTGVVGAALTAGVIFVLAMSWYTARQFQPRPEWTLAGATVALAIGASLGMPSLTGNRVGTLLWLLLTCLVLAHRKLVTWPAGAHRVVLPYSVPAPAAPSPTSTTRRGTADGAHPPSGSTNPRPPERGAFAPQVR